MVQDENHGYGRDQVIQIINSVIGKVEKAEEFSREGLFNELAELKRVIEEARAEVGMTNPGAIKDEHIPTATDELDAVVEATAEATGAIMDACEAIEEVAGKVGGDDGGAISLQVTNIYEACSFQDITGQRITKVVTTLKTIEQKVDRLITVLGGKIPELENGAVKEEDDGKDPLLNGPQMADQAITQDEIDRLLDEFD